MTKIQLLSLKNQKSFELVSKEAPKYSCPYFLLIASRILDQTDKLTNKIPHLTKNHIYLGFKISKKYGKANRRNLLRRRVKNIIQTQMQKSFTPMNLIFIPRTILKNIEYSEISSEMGKAISWLDKKI